MYRASWADALAPALLLILCTPQPVTAATGIEDTSVYLRLTWGLLVVLGIILIFYALVKKRFSLLQSPEKSAIKVLELRHLMPKKSLCLVEVKGRQYLLGLGTDNITLLARIPAAAEKTFATALQESTEQTTP